MPLISDDISASAAEIRSPQALKRISGVMLQYARLNRLLKNSNRTARGTEVRLAGIKNKQLIGTEAVP
jgi:cytochrome c2